MHPSWNNSASGSWQWAANWRLIIPTSPRLARMNRCRATSPRSSRICSSTSVASEKPAPDVRASRASRPASIARCSSTTSACVSSRPVGSSNASVMPTLWGTHSLTQQLVGLNLWISGCRFLATAQGTNPRPQCCGCATPCGAPPTQRARRTSGCTCAVHQPGSSAAVSTSAPRWSASR
jgi:hypothetical protein